MIDVALTYGRKKQSVSLPGSWHDVSPEDAPKLLTWASLLDPGYALLAAIEHYIPSKFLKGLGQEAIEQFAHLFHWYEVGPQPTAYIRYIKIDGKRHHMPSARFSNGTAMEYPLADEFYTKIVESEDPDERMTNLRLLAATLYREKKKGKRAPLKGRADVSKRAKKFANIEEIYLLNALYYFAGCKKDIHEIYQHTIFRKMEDDQEESSESGTAYFGWWGMYMDIAEAGLFGDIEKVHQTGFHTICMYLSKKYLEAQDRKEREMFNKTSNDAD